MTDIVNILDLDEDQLLVQFKARDHLIKSLRQQLAECQALEKVFREALSQAAEDMDDWGAYASEYFQEKWNLKGDVENLLKLAAMPSDSTALDTYLKENGWRQCAKGQSTTQWCGATEEAVKQAKRETLLEAAQIFDERAGCTNVVGGRTTLAAIDLRRMADALA
jgi:hypothetical protein